MLHLILLYLPNGSALSQQDLLQEVPGCSTAIKLKSIPGGSFMMGKSGLSNAKDSNEKMVTISPFYMSIYETTYEQYHAFVEDENYSRNTAVDAVTRPSPPYIDFTLGMGKEGYPASSMQQHGALMFCKWLYAKTGQFFRLPTEAEWEYACIGGANFNWPAASDSVAWHQYAWFGGNSQNKYQLVGQLQPNGYGLYDMLGNVSEWVLDEYDPNYLATIGSKATDPLIMATKRNPRSVRGGNYQSHIAMLNPALRHIANPIWNRRDPQIPKSRWWNTDAPFVGFRVVKPVKQPTAEEAELFFNTFLLQ